MWNIDKHRTLHTRFLPTPETEEEVLALLNIDPDVRVIEQRVDSSAVSSSFDEVTELARFRFDADDVATVPHVEAKGPLPTHVMIGYPKSPGRSELRIGLRAWDRIFDRIDRLVADVVRVL
jgi:hypothetical protein